MEKFEAIRRRWISSQSREIPQDLRDALNDQVKACDNLLSGKNVLLDDLNRELKGIKRSLNYDHTLTIIRIRGRVCEDIEEAV